MTTKKLLFFVLYILRKFLGGNKNIQGTEILQLMALMMLCRSVQEKWF